MRLQRLTLVRALALSLPLFLAGCGSDGPVDPCKTFEKKFKGKDVSNARERAYASIEKRKKSIAKKFKKPIQFGTPTVTCTMPEPKKAKPKKVKADDPWATKTKKEKPPQAICEVVLPYCVK
jgi:hypothetical protein